MSQPSVISREINGRQIELRYPASEALEAVVRGILDNAEYPILYPKGFLPTTIIDVGGNVGAAAIWFAVNCPNAHVYSLEPSPSLFEYLSSNVAGFPQITPLNVGLSDQTGQGRLHIAESNVAQNSLIEHSASGEETEPVTIYRASELFDDLQLDRISILKVDTEGSEVPILQDLEEQLDQVEAIYVEYHSEDDRRAIDTIMAERFYLVHANVHFPNLGTLVYFAKSSMDNSARYVSPPIRRPPV